MVIVSFPGIYEEEWNNLVATAKLMQALGSERSWFSSACIFLPDGDANLGEHDLDAVTQNGQCYCTKLYGGPKPWGCRWFKFWRQQLHLGLERGQRPVVVYKAGQVGEGDAATWEQFPIPFSTNRRGLGGSQAGEVAYLRHYLSLLGHGDGFDKMDVYELTDSMIQESWEKMKLAVQGDEGGKRLATVLMSTPEVQKGLAYLIVPACNLGEVAGLALARALPACLALKRISLWGNSLGDAAGRAIARALPACAALEDVDLSRAGLGEAAGLELAQALPSLPALTRMDLEGNGLEATGYLSFWRRGARAGRALREAAAARGVQLWL